MPAGAIDAAEAIELDLSVVGDISRPPAVKEAVDEFRFDGVVLSSVQPDVKTSRLGWIVIFRQRHAVRENCAVNLGCVSMDLLLALIPLRLIRLKLSAAFDPLSEA
jgi:hypothetical protein